MLGFSGYFLENHKITKVADHTAAGVTDVTSASVDMAEDGGYEGVVFVTSFGTAASDNKLKAQQSSDDGSSDGFSDLADTAVASGSSDEDVMLEIQKPVKRYVKVVAVRGTSSTCESIWAIRYKPRNLPIDNSVSGTQIAEKHHAPAEGTA